MYSNWEKWTFGAEHELADWFYDVQLPSGYGRDVRDVTIVNSNGIANDPKGISYSYGGEINTPPTNTIHQQVRCLRELKTLLPEATVNYRSNLHIHIHVPGLKNDLEMLKQIQLHIHTEMPKAFNTIDPLPTITKKDFPIEEEYKGAIKRKNRNKMSHHNLLSKARLEKQLSAKTLEEFFNFEAPLRKSDGAPQFHLQPRLCVNIRQLLETDTIEFRHWFGTLDEEELRNAFEWCRAYLGRAIENKPIDDLVKNCQNVKFPRPLPYDHFLEVRYQLTKHGGDLKREEIEANIKKILEEDYA